jgi:hypothetical protein
MPRLQVHTILEGDLLFIMSVWSQQYRAPKLSSGRGGHPMSKPMTLARRPFSRVDSQGPAALSAARSRALLFRKPFKTRSLVQNDCGKELSHCPHTP